MTVQNMKIRLALPIIATALAGAPASSAKEVGTKLDQMPAELEARFALSALPPALRDHAGVYLLDPEKGYELTKEGSSGVTCLIERTAWEKADFRNDIYIPLCYDAVGTETHLQVKLDAAALRAQGMEPEELKAELEGRYADNTYKVPKKAGVSYMVAPLQRTYGPPDMKVHTLSIPHYMPYAPNVTNEDIGATPDLAEPASLYRPFIDRQGYDEQSYLIFFVGQMERDQILADEQALLEDLCAYRDVFCDPQTLD